MSTENGQKASLASQKKYDTIRRQTPERKMKKKANDAVRRAIKKGEIVKIPCEICGDPNSQAHHAWGYDPENRLKVIFLCQSHHRQAESE